MVVLKAKHYLSAVVLVSLMLLVYDSLRAGLADINAHQYERLEKRWMLNKGIELVDNDLKRAEAFLSQAISLYPGHPDYFHLKGRLAVWQLLSSSDKEISGVDDAASWMKRSAELRPYWPYLYIDKVLWLSHQLEIGKNQENDDTSNFNKLWLQTFKLGGRETEVAKSLLVAGLQHWDRLDWQVRGEVVRLLTVSLSGQPGRGYFALSLIKKYGLVTSICQFYVTQSNVPELMQKHCDS